MTDAARFADVVLPATTFLEHPDLYKSYGHYTLQLAEAVLPPTGAARCNHEVLNTTFSATPSAARRLPPRFWIHPEDATARGNADGDRVEVARMVS
jgi:anaerobic selenocysteine-containing dehydrogenase